MDPSAPPLSLDAADSLRPAALDPSIWIRNLAALSSDSPELAAELAEVRLPDAWRPALAIDGFPTYRLEGPGQPPQWLGRTAAPLTRAGGLLARAEPAAKNVALSCGGAGAELHVLLQRLSPLLALYVFETDARVLAALLRLHDLEAPIARGRCILLPPGRELEALDRLLDTHPGLLPPAEIVLPDLVSRERQDELRRIGEEAHRRCEQRRSDELEQCRATVAATSIAPAAPPRLAVLSLTGSPIAHGAAECVHRAARGLGWEATCLAVADPRGVHPLVHVRALAAFRPSLILFVNHGPSRLPLAWPATTCIWVQDESAVPPQPAAEPVLYLAATPRLAAALEGAGLSETAVLPWYWACEPTEGGDDGPADDNVLLIADLPDTRPANCGITQTTHQQLWEHLRQLAVRAWQTPHVLQPNRLLAQAERECRVELADAPLRDTLLRLTERFLLPAVIAEQVARTLLDDTGRLHVLGRGWERLGLEKLRRIGSHVYESPDGGAGGRPRACVLAGQRDPLHPALLHAAARGWPLLLHRPGGASLTAALGGVLRPDEHFEPFSDLAELKRALKSMRGNPQAARMRAARARQHVAAKHAFRCRLEVLLDALREGGPASA